MRLIVLLLTALFLLLFAETTLACSFDTDCEVGSRCAKATGAIYGVCVGGLFPGNKHDREPVYSPTDLNRTYGNTCSFDIDCGPGSTCFKPQGGLYGTCLRRR